MSRLILVRHGNTKLNSAQRFWGQTDVELSEVWLVPSLTWENIKARGI